MKKSLNVEEWVGSAIAPSLIKLNKKRLEEEEIAEWYFQNLPSSARRNDGRIRDGYLIRQCQIKEPAQSRLS